MSNSSNERKKIRIAVATSDGKRVDQHFARSEYFDIYEVEETNWVFVDRKSNSDGRCGCHDEHGGAAFEEIISRISDCRFVIALRIGNGAVSYLVDRGIRASQIDDTTENALNTIISSGKLKNLLR